MVTPAENVAEAVLPAVTVPFEGREAGAGEPAVYATASVVGHVVFTAGCVQLYVVLQLPIPLSLVFSVASAGATRLGAGRTVTTTGEEVAEHPFASVVVAV